MTTLRVGAAKEALAPPVGGRMAGYALRSSAATGTHDDLQCRATVFDDGGTVLVLVVCDLVYATRAITDLARRYVAAALSIAEEQVMITATHTHCGPAELATPSGADLQEHIADRIRAAAEAAMGARRPARLVVGARSVPGISANRRSAASPADDLAHVLVAYPADGTDPIATIVNFACHATVLEHSTIEYSADFPGAMCAALEAQGGGIATYLQGCAGDVNPVYATHTWADCGRIGGILAAAGMQVILDGAGLLHGLHLINPSWNEELDAAERSGVRVVPAGQLDCSSSLVAVTAAPISPDRPDTVDDVPMPSVEQRRRQAMQTSLRWIQDLRADDSLFGVFDEPTAELDTLEVQRFRLGTGLDLVALPGEPFQSAARAIRDAVPGTVLVAGYANQSAAYLPPAPAFADLGYEVGCCQYASGTAEAVTAAAQQLLAER